MIIERKLFLVSNECIMIDFYFLININNVFSEIEDYFSCKYNIRKKIIKNIRSYKTFRYNESMDDSVKLLTFPSRLLMEN